QWSTAASAGFTTGKPWLPVAADAAQVNVESQRDDQGSILTLYCRLIALRRGEPALEVGRFEPVRVEGDVLAYVRRSRKDESDFLVALNLGSRPHALRGLGNSSRGTIALSTHLDRAGETVGEELALRADEGVIVRLAP